LPDDLLPSPSGVAAVEALLANENCSISPAFCCEEVGEAGVMHDVRNLIPAHKADLERAQAAVRAGYPEVEPILGELVEWLQDYNWPVAHVLAPFLASLGAPLAPHISRVFQTDDCLWKYWVIIFLVRSLPEDAAAGFRPELERLCHTPQPNEKEEELDQQARKVLEHFGWLQEHAKPSGSS
jgi:hypothetical protein